MVLEHDVLFKQVFRKFLPEFIALALPWLKTAEGEVPRFLPTEFHFPRPRDHDAGNDHGKGGGSAPPPNPPLSRTADLVAQIRTGDGPEDEAILLLETERDFREVAAHRLREYSDLARLTYGKKVVPVKVHLTGGGKGRAGVVEQTLSDTVQGKKLNDFTYWSFYLQNCSAQQYLDLKEPMAAALAALMDPGDLSPVEHKLACLRVLFDDPDLTPERRRLLRFCVDKYIDLNDEETLEFDSRLRKEIPMALAEMTLEQIYHDKGRQQGREEGRLEGRRRLLLRLLELRFGSVGETVQHQVDRLQSEEELDRLAERVLTATSLEEMGLG